MKHIIYYLILACFVCGFTACSKLSKAAKYEAKVEECIAKRDFLSARNYYHKYAGLNLIGMGKERDQLLRKLNIAEINYVMDQSGLEDAYFLADELCVRICFLEALSSNITKMINSGQTDKILNILVTWSFESAFPTGSSTYKESESYQQFVWESNAYNAILDAIISSACFNEDAALAKKVIKLYRPILKIHDVPEGWSYSRDNTPKSLAIKKVKEAGIKL